MCHRCFCCDRMWFSNGITNLESVDESVQKCFEYISIDGYMVCHTCKKSLLQKIIPLLARINGYCSSKKPDLPVLNKVEERLISLLLPFSEIRKLGRDGQLGIKGNIINVPIDVDQTVCSLPRNIDDDCSINIHLKKEISVQISLLN